MTKTNMLYAEDVPLPSDSDDEVTLEDDDTCSPFELERQFAEKYKILDETALSLKKEYILSLAKDDSFTRLAAGLSDTSVHLFDINSERGLSPYVQLPCNAEPNKKVQICGIRFVDETPNTLLVGTTDGIVRLFDIRSQKEEARFEKECDSADGGKDPKCISSFDRNANSRVLCTGTMELHSSVYLIFYDLRQGKHMGAYFDSHNDDITTLRFHPHNPDILASGSVDGLINIFDLRESDEQQALLTTINTESSVHKINWHKNVYNKDILSCITHTNDFNVYESEEGDVIAEFGRDTITENIRRKTPANCTLIDAHNTSDSGVFLLTGSNSHKGEIMRSLRLQNKQLLPFANFDGNKQIVRESVFDTNSNVLITAGEGSIVTLWSPQAVGAAVDTSGSSKLKVKKSKLNKATPY